MNDTHGVRIALVTIFVIIIAMAAGYRRGAAREGVTTLFLVLFTSLLSTSTGYAFITGLNQLGQNVILFGTRLLAAVQRTGGAQPGADALKDFQLVPKNQQEVVLFVLFLLGVYIAYRVGEFPGLKKMSHPSAGGALLGLLNAYILALILLPDLPDAVPAPQALLNSQQMTAQAAETFRLVARSIGVTFSTSTLMTAIILLVAGLMYWAVSELR